MIILLLFLWIANFSMSGDSDIFDGLEDIVDLPETPIKKPNSPQKRKFTELNSKGSAVANGL